MNVYQGPSGAQGKTLCRAEGCTSRCSDKASRPGPWLGLSFVGSKKEMVRAPRRTLDHARCLLCWSIIIAVRDVMRKAGGGDPP